MGERVVIDAFLEVSIPLLMVLLSPLIDSIANQVVWLFKVITSFCQNKAIIKTIESNHCLKSDVSQYCPYKKASIFVDDIDSFESYHIGLWLKLDDWIV